MEPWPSQGRLFADDRAEEAERTRRAAPRRGRPAYVPGDEGFRVLADAMPQLVWSAGPDGAVDYANVRHREYAVEAGPDGAPDWRSVVHPDDREATAAAWQRARAAGARYEVEHRLRRADGTYAWHVSRATPVRDPEGRVARWFGTATDIDALKRAEQSLREEDRRKTQFLAVLSHELRNPLAPVRNGLHVLERTPAGSPQHERARVVIRRQVDHLTRLLDDLLDVTRIGHGKIALQRARLDAREVARRACDDVRSSFEERGVGLRVDVPADPLWVDADAARLAQIAGNLLHNAARFTPPGGAVDVVLRRAGAMAELAVRDTGVGIDAGDLERIFEPFAQAGGENPGVAYGGIGLGLALVRSLAALHGGTARARSDGRGRGAEITVSLPLAAAPGGRPGVAGRGPEAPLRILVVEDNPDAADTLADLLRLEGHEVHVANDGPQGLAAVEALRPDALLCDMGLPGLSGYEVMAALRARGGELPYAVALTGYAQPEDRRRALDAGFDAHLPKPPSVEALEQALREVAARRRGQAV